MAILRTAADSPNLLTHLATALGSIADGDEVQVEKYSQDFTAGTNLSTKDLVKVTLGPGSRSRFVAASGGALTLVCNRTSTGRFINQSSADQVEVVSSSTSGVIYTVENKPANVSGIFRLNTCDTDTVWQIAGTMYQQTDADVATVIVLGGRFFARAGSAAHTTLSVNGGIAETERDAGTVNVSAGTLRVNGTAFTPTTVNLKGTGTIKVLETGNWGTLNAESGTIDLTECKSFGGTTGYLFTISAGSISPGVVIRQLRGGLLPNYSGCSLPAGGPRIEYI